jgi:hypothetical protein
MDDVAFFATYGETSRVVGLFEEPADTIAMRILDLHRRQARAVCDAFDQATRANASALREGDLPQDCLLSLVLGLDRLAAAYPELAPGIAQVIQAEPRICLAIDEEKKRVVFERWGEVTGVGAGLIVALAGPFRKAAREERAPKNYPFVETRDLMSQTNCDAEEILHRRIKLFRTRISKLANAAGDPTPSLDAVIENLQWHGYRLNPYRVRIVKMSELRTVSPDQTLH